MFSEMFEQYYPHSDNRTRWRKLKDDLNDAVSALLYIGSLIVVLVAIVWYSISPPGIAPADFARLMRQEAITEAQPVSVSLFSCGEGDGFATGFRGIKNGQPVKGVICSGIFKSNTIRYD